MKETIYIGIDIAKYKHDFCIISSTGEVIVQNNSFENNKKRIKMTNIYHFNSRLTANTKI